MLYDIRLAISYDYDSPAGASRSLLRMLPRGSADQQLLMGEVSTDPMPSWRRDGVDFFGNATTEVAHDRPLREIEFRFEGRVQRNAPLQGLDLSPPWPALAPEIAAIHSVAPDAPHHFLGASPRLPAAPEIARFCRSVVSEDMTALTATRAVSDALHALFDFNPEATEVTTAPIDAFRARAGVCQDISHVMITGLRSLGIPAGYVSGFLRTEPPKGKPRLEGADAMHAWVTAWCGAETGWMQVDPTNAMDAGLDHVEVALGRDYGDVAPVKGSLRSSGSHTTTHAVDVVPVG
ncbi:transglutaminase family protein [Mesobacterium pallidum]|uniref:transglutaminase family protein n=1 Tax=Mesobacterium pallidum TaxID=2872037 RepID=UPI001EE211D3|nr:transglutaminase family protein [Mesobacterium pallidum]